MCSECNFPPMGIKYETHTKESMYAYLETLAEKYKEWKREEGIMEKSGLPWVSFENALGSWMHYYRLNENGGLSKHEFNPNAIVNLRVKE